MTMAARASEQPLSSRSVRPMRIGLFFWSLELGGVEHMLINLSRELVERGHEVELILARSPQPNSYEPDPRVKVTWLHQPGIGGLIKALTAHLKVNSYDSIFTGMPTSNVALLLARRLAGATRRTPVVISERSNPILEAQSSRTWRYRASFRLQRYVYPWADQIIAVSTDLADALARSAHLPRNRIEVVFNPAFDERTPPPEGPPPHIWLADKTVPVVIGAGRFRPQKDFSTFLKVIAKVAAKRPIRAILLGDGEEQAELVAQAQALGIADKVAFPGFVNDVAPWLTHADIFLMTSRWEGFGNILVQALGAGCGMVSTDCPDGPGEILGRGEFGHLAPVGDVDALAAGLERALDQPFDRTRQHGRALDFTVTRSADRYEALFEELSSRRKAG